MRVRDIVRNSFARLVEGGALPHYVRPDRNGPLVVNDERSDQRKLSRPGVPELGLYADLVAWRQAVDFIRAFTAAATTGTRAQWQLPAWMGTVLDRPSSPLAARWPPRPLRAAPERAHGGMKRDRVLGKGG